MLGTKGTQPQSAVSYECSQNQIINKCPLSFCVFGSPGAMRRRGRERGCRVSQEGTVSAPIPDVLGSWDKHMLCTNPERDRRNPQLFPSKDGTLSPSNVHLSCAVAILCVQGSVSGRQLKCWEELAFVSKVEGKDMGPEFGCSGGSGSPWTTGRYNFPRVSPLACFQWG